MIFDTHAHVLSADRDTYPFGALRGGEVAPVTPVIFEVEELIAQMNALGVDRACLVQRATLYGYDNRYALTSAARFADRLAPIVVLDAQDKAAPETLRTLASSHALAGLRIVAPSLSKDNTDWLDSPQTHELWSAAQDLGLPVAVIIYRLNNAAGLAAMARIAKKFTRAPIIVDHAGLPHPSNPEMKWAAANGHDYAIPTSADFGIGAHLCEFDGMDHVYFKVTDINFDRLDDAGLDAGNFLKALAARFGAERLIWGSDVGQSPAPYEKKVSRLKRATQTLDHDVREAFLGGNAKRLYGSAMKNG